MTKPLTARAFLKTLKNMKRKDFIKSLPEGLTDEERRVTIREYNKQLFDHFKEYGLANKTNE